MYDHPQIAPLLIVVDQPHTAGVELAVFDHRLRQRAEEALDVRLAHQQIQGKLDHLGLDLHAALGPAAFGSLANQRGAQHLWIGRRDLNGLTSPVVSIA